jgi:hypothetical protein
MGTRQKKENIFTDRLDPAMPKTPWCVADGAPPSAANAKGIEFVPRPAKFFIGSTSD